MKQEFFERLVRTRLRAHRPEVDTDKLWSQLQPQVKRRRHTGGAWLLSLVGAMLLGGGAYAVWHMSAAAGGTEALSFHEKYPEEAPASPHFTAPAHDLPAGLNQSGGGAASDEEVASGLRGGLLPAASQGEGPSEVRQSIAGPLGGEDDTGTTANGTANVTGDGGDVAGATAGGANDGGHNPAEAAAAAAAGAEPEPTRSRDAGTAHTEAATGAETAAATTADNRGSTAHSTRAATSHIPAAGTEALFTKEKEAMPRIIAARPQALQSEERSRALPQPNEDFTPRPVHNKLGIFAGIGMSFRQIEATAPEWAKDINARDKSEQILEHWSLGLNFRHSRGRWFADLGLTALKINEKSDFTISRVDTLVLDNVITERIIKNGVVIEERRGSVTVYERTERRTVNYPSLWQLSGHLGLGYSWPLTSAMSIGTSAGMHYAFYSRYAGTVNMARYYEYDLQEDSEGLFRDKGMGLGAYLQLDMNLDLPGRWAFSSSIQGLSFPEGLSRDNEIFRQRYSLLTGRITAYLKL